MTPEAPTPDTRHFDFAALSAPERYKLLTAVVVPRPIAWVSTLGPGGEVNLAPYSFFGLMGSDPGVVAFAPGDRPDGTPKDTALNIGSGGEFSQIFDVDNGDLLLVDDWEMLQLRNPPVQG